MELSIIQPNVNRMLECRGHQILQKKVDICIYGNDDGAKILVLYYTSEKLNIDAIKDFILVLEEAKIHHGIIIYHGNVTASTRKVLEHLHKFRIELFSSKEFRYCLIDHRFYCPHRRLPPDEAEEIKNTFGTNLPVLLRTDAVARYFHFTKNDIIEVTRKNDSIAYRIVK